MRAIIVVSFYDKRDDDELNELLRLLQPYNEQILVVVNTDDLIFQPCVPSNIRSLPNANIGMNIGAWDRAFKEYPDQDVYIFLQDECFLKRDGFLNFIVNRFHSEPLLGMVGESLNYKWAMPWDQLRQSPLNSNAPEHLAHGNVVGRVDCYLQAMKNWGIDPGQTGIHLRSLIWAFRGKVLRELGGFPLGGNKGECIAAEIAVSRQVASLGYEFDQLVETPFFFFGHSEWRADGSSKHR